MDADERFLKTFAAACAALGLFLYISFFLNFRSTLSDWSAFGFVWPYQLFYNFLHGRPFQNSIFATAAGGSSVGFTHNPYAYIHANVVHVNFTPYLFAWIWALRPTPAFLYFLVFAWNLLAGAFFSWLILRAFGARKTEAQALFAAAVLVGGGLMNVADQMAQFLLFTGPLFLAAYYFMLIRRRGLFLLAIAAICLTTEDAAMVAACFAGYLFIFEPENRSYAWTCGAFALPYLLLLMLVVQPASRADLTLTGSTTTAIVVKHVADYLTPAGLWMNVKSLAPVLSLAPAFALAGLLWGWPSAGTAFRLAALALLPALPHWGESLVVGGAHHLEPPFFFTFLALLVMIARAPGRAGFGRPAWAMAALFLLLSLRVNAGNLPNAIKPALYRLAGKTDKTALLEKSLTSEAASNRAVIDVAQSLPPSASLVYLVNNHVTGFIAGRSDVWQFPDFYGLADYVLIQKDADDLMFSFDPAAGKDLKETLAHSGKAEKRGAAMAPEMIRLIKEALAPSYKIAINDAHVLLFQRQTRHSFYIPPETIGLGWRKNLFLPKNRPHLSPRY